ncbi:MAG: adenine deaminase [Thermosynechococcaceae cyanobacterium]
MDRFSISGHIVDLFRNTVFPGTVWIQDGCIQAIAQDETPHNDQYILPGFVDAHIHIESSMLPPSEFARLATIQGTVAVVSDPHEIANVLGLEGVRFMVANAAQTPFEIAFGAPSCVPATFFETAGAELTARDIRILFEEDGLTYLSEMMNVPGVLNQDPGVMEKLHTAQSFGCPIDGHAPGLMGAQAHQYASAGITTEHECLRLQEALDKLDAGMKILIREGSAAQNFEMLHSLIETHHDLCMFCSDDKHPDALVHGHINTLVQRAVSLGHDVMKVLQVACLNPVRHYGLKVGLLQVGDPADFIAVNNLQSFEVRQTYCKGQLVAKEGQPLLPRIPIQPINQFVAQPLTSEAFRLPADGAKNVRVIEALNGELVTSERIEPAPIVDGEIQSDVSRDILKIAVVNRYAIVPPAVALIHNFNLQRGAIASSVAHDSHNIVAVGATDAELCAAVNAVIRSKGGIAIAKGDDIEVLELPIAGLMSTEDGFQVAEQYSRMDAHVKRLGSQLSAPFMTLSFMALLVIPDLKLSDRGLFSGQDFHFVPLCL